MGNTSSGFVEPFSQCPIDVRVQRSWFARSWRDTSGENSTLRARALTSLPNDFQLVIQESSIALGFGKAYRLVIAPLRDNGKVIVIAPHLTHFQEALSMMMTVYLQSFRLSSPFRCFDDGRECVGSSDTISPVGAWPPAQDRLSLGAQYDGTENENGVIRLLSSDLSCGVGSDADIEVDIILWHGLGGNPETSWIPDNDPSAWPIWRLLDPGNPRNNLYTAEDNGVPRNSLPRQHKIRVLSVSHKLSVIGRGSDLTDEDPRTTAKAIWESLARAQVGLRPAIWLCHSLGSLLAKEVLMLDDAEEENGLRLCENLRGVIFYGAPHNGSQWAGALATTHLSIDLHPLTFQLNIARQALQYLSHSNSERHQELNHFFFGRTQIPFLNLQENRTVRITRFASSAQIVGLQESDVVPHMPLGRKMITQRILPLDFLNHPKQLCAQADVPFNHLDICKPPWEGSCPHRIYTWSREAIAVWLTWVPQGNSLPLTTPGAWSAQLALEVAAMQAAMAVDLGMEVAEALYYTCAWSDDPLEQSHARDRPDLHHCDRGLLHTGVGYSAGISGLATSFATSTPGSVNPLLVLHAASAILGTTALFATGSAVLTQAQLAPVIAIILLVALALSGEARQAVQDAYQTLSLDTLQLARDRPDIVHISGVLEKHLSDTFKRIDNYRYLSPANKNSLKHRWLRRYRDILCAQLLPPTSRIDLTMVDLLAEARSKLDKVEKGRNIPAILRRLQSIRAEYRDARQARRQTSL